MRARSLLFYSLSLMGTLALVRPAAAQDEPEGEEAAEEEAAEGGGEGEGEAKPEAEGETPAATTPPPETGADAESSPIEKRGETYRFVGLRYRGIIVPKFMMNLFGDGGTTVYIHGFGPEFGIRKDNFEYIFSLWYAPYSMDPTPFKASSDPDQGWEHVESKLKLLFLTADFQWSAVIEPEVAFNYGIGAGFAFVFGSLHRSQVRPGPQSTSDPATYVPCRVPDGDYCAAEDPFLGAEEPSWANGGSKPIIFPWLVAQFGFRIKPHRNFVGRIDFGFGTSGFFWGLGLDYGL
jgi:hypothetical protein